MLASRIHVLFFFFNDTATTEIYTLSLHDALPILNRYRRKAVIFRDQDGKTIFQFRLYRFGQLDSKNVVRQDRKSTRLNSSHANISYAVFCLKKKKLFPHIVIYYFSSTVTAYYLPI